MSTKKPLPSLKAMAEEKIDGIQKATFFKVDPDKVEFEEGFNLREEGPELDEHLTRMYVAMKAGTYFPPIDVQVVDGRIITRDGHCRTRTARRLKAEGIPYMLEARQVRGNEVDAVIHMIGSDQGKKFTPLEQGRGFLRLIGYNMTVQQIADRLGLSRTTVDNGLLLAEAPVEVQHLLVSGQVAVSVVLDAIKKHGSKGAAAALQALVAKVKGQGAAKVTKRHIAAPRVPAKTVERYVSITATLRDTVDSAGTLSLLDDEDVVEVPAKLLKELFALSGEGL